MFEKIAKKLGGKTTDQVVEGAKQTLNDRMNKYTDIIQIGLVTLVIAFGGNKLIGHGRKRTGDQNPGYSANPPIVINNYYSQQDPVVRNPYRNNPNYKGAYYGRKTEKDRNKY